jgi:threonine dehydratase
MARITKSRCRAGGGLCYEKSSCRKLTGDTSMTLPTFADVEQAARTLKGIAVRTPLLSSPALDEMTGGRVFFKAEPLQLTGSFKFRGAYNRISAIPLDKRAGGVVAMSSGNHAQGVARAAKLLGLPAVIVMPKDSPALKVERTRADGAEVVLFDREKDDRDAIAGRIRDERGMTLVPPFNDPLIAAGQGTAGLEIIEDLQALGLLPDAVLAPVSGGGLIGGVGLAVRHFAPKADIHGVEPEGFDDFTLSLQKGERVGNTRLSGSICDGLLAPMSGDITFAVNKALGVTGLVVSDAEAGEAVAFAFRELKLVVEPSGATVIAAILKGRLKVKGRVIAAVLSGGNVDPALYASLIS